MNTPQKTRAISTSPMTSDEGNQTPSSPGSLINEDGKSPVHQNQDSAEQAAESEEDEPEDPPSSTASTVTTTTKTVTYNTIAPKTPKIS